MEDSKVNIDDIDWEDEYSFSGCLYQGKKFTGIVFEDEELFYDEETFLEGIRHGRAFYFSKIENKILRESFYQNGKPSGTHFSWIERLSKKVTKTFSKGEIESATVKNRDEILLFEYTKSNKTFKEWYENGVLSSEKILYSTDNYYQFESEKYWDQNKVWLMSVKDKTDYEFNTKYLLENSFQLHTAEQENIFIQFAEHLYKIDENSALDFLHKNIEHPDAFFRYEAARLLGNIKNIKSIPYLEQLLNDNSQPARGPITNWLESSLSCKTQFPICKMAEIALENIKTQN